MIRDYGQQVYQSFANAVSVPDRDMDAEADMSGSRCKKRFDEAAKVARSSIAAQAPSEVVPQQVGRPQGDSLRLREAWSEMMGMAEAGAPGPPQITGAERAGCVRTWSEPEFLAPSGREGGVVKVWSSGAWSCCGDSGSAACIACPAVAQEQGIRAGLSA